VRLALLDRSSSEDFAVSDQPSPAPTPAAPQPSAGDLNAKQPADRGVIVRPMPKVVFFYLTWLASLVMGIVAAMSGNDHQPAHLGTVWMCIFAFNLIVISFDFNETLSIAAILGVFVLVFAGLYFHFLSFIGEFFTHANIAMNSGFYFAMFVLFSVMYLFVFIHSRFQYWEFRHNEVLHRAGMFGEIKRYSTEDMRWFKEIPDVLERILLKSGRMVLTTPREPQPIVIEHILGIESVDERIAELLGSKRVTFK
jgi:hypothetical protein